MERIQVEKEANTNISFVEMEDTDATAYLYANASLFEYTDSNSTGNVDQDYPRLALLQLKMQKQVKSSGVGKRGSC